MMQARKFLTTLLVLIAVVTGGIVFFNQAQDTAAQVGEYPYPADQPTGLLAINEVSWSGTAASSSDEWFELVTAADAVNTNGWRLVLTRTDSTTSTITLPEVVIPANSIALFERTDDNAVSTVAADGIYAGSLANTGVTLFELKTPEGDVSHRVAMTDSNNWPAGSASPRASMQMVNDSIGTLRWYTSNQGTELDMNGNGILGTPGSVNELPSENPFTCGQTPDEWAYDLDIDLIGEEFLPVIKVAAELWAVDEHGSLVETDGWSELHFLDANWQVMEMGTDAGTTSECVAALGYITDTAEAVANGGDSSGGEANYVDWLTAVSKYVNEETFRVFLPTITRITSD